MALAAPLVIAAAAGAAAQSTAEPPTADARLAPVVVTAPPPVAASSELLIPGKDFELLPQGRPADVLRLVPGLIMSQHQGGGKSEQYLLRGFDADHGTDVALFVDGMPVNLRTHAHGQGYADLHFLIPETIKQVDAFKGPYYVEYGDFATAGAIDFVTRDTVPENLVQAAGGSFGTQRYLTLLSPTRDRVKTLFALEAYTSDGPFDRPQDYQRLNAFAKASATLGDGVDGSIWASYLRRSWFGSGQIPARAVRAGLIDRFGSIDDSEGGRTERASLNGQIRWKRTDADLVTLRAWGQYYSLDLFSDFTFFLDDPVNGDGIKQTDRDRLVGGLDARYEHRDTVAGVPVLAMAGVQYRMDRSRVILAHQADRHLLERMQDVSFVEQSFSPMVRLDLDPLPWLRFVTGARGDIFQYDVRNNLSGSAERLEGDQTRAVPSVKANLVLGPWADTEFFANFGTGFHSNDARAVVIDPRTPALPQARGYEFGVRTRILPRAEISATYWVLDLKSELVFAGDDGTTEARAGLGGRDPGPTARLAHVERQRDPDRFRLRQRAGDPARAAGDRAGRPHRPAAVGPVGQRDDAVRGRPLRRREPPADRPRLHPPRPERPLSLQERGGLPERRERGQCPVARGPVLLRLAAARRADGRGPGHPLHARHPADIPRRAGFPLLARFAGNRD
jgi:outer membrane receptor protein involved in Fe transport